jgi:hypothetical protein
MEDILKYENRDQLYRFLIDNFGLVKVEEKYDPKTFGNFFITLSAKEFFLRYINDRSILTIEIASQNEPGQWYDLSFIKDFVYKTGNINEDYKEFDNTNRIKELNIFLSKEFDLISDLFNRDNYRDTKQKLDELLKQQFYRKFK